MLSERFVLVDLDSGFHFSLSPVRPCFSVENLEKGAMFMAWTIQCTGNGRGLNFDCRE